MSGLWEQLVDAVIRPPRDVYTEADLVGGRKATFRLYGARYYRQDLTLHNERGQKLVCSHYRPCMVRSRDGRLPAVIYCHCNSGSRRDAEEILWHLLPRQVTVLALDCAGSGLSEGAYVSLGAYEVEDVAAAVAYLRSEGGACSVGLWGRSMGAVSALLLAARDPSLAGVVADSAFSRLADLMLELSSETALRIPRPFARLALAAMRRSVRRRAGFQLEAAAPLDAVPGAHVPALFGHARADSLVGAHHSRLLQAAYAGEARLCEFEGDHNSVRPDAFYEQAVEFLLGALSFGDELPGLGEPQAGEGGGQARAARQAASRAPAARSRIPAASQASFSPLSEGEASLAHLFPRPSAARAPPEVDSDSGSDSGAEFKAALQRALEESLADSREAGPRSRAEEEAQVLEALRLSMLSDGVEAEGQGGPAREHARAEEDAVRGAQEGVRVKARESVAGGVAGGLGGGRG